MLVPRQAVFLLALVLAWSLPCVARAQAAAAPKVTSAHILEFGIYSSNVDAFIVDGSVADNGKILSENFRLIQETDVIPARLGLGFGVKYEVLGEPKGS